MLVKGKEKKSQNCLLSLTRKQTHATSLLSLNFTTEINRTVEEKASNERIGGNEKKKKTKKLVVRLKHVPICPPAGDKLKLVYKSTSTQ